MRPLHLALAVGLMAAIPAPDVGAQDACLGAADGSTCADDGDPCTTDTCLGESCRHDAVPNRITCDPVQDAYRRTLGLTVLTVESGALAATLGLPDSARTALAQALPPIEASLTRATEALAGRLPIPPLASGETLAQARARAAFGIVRDIPGLARGAHKALRAPAVQAVGPLATDLARRMRFLYRSLSKLKRELRRLQRVSGVLAR